MEQQISIRQPPRRFRCDVGSVRTTPMSCLHFAASAGYLPATFPAICWVRGVHMPGSKCCFQRPNGPAKSSRWHLTRPTAVRPIYTTSPLLLDEITTMSPQHLEHFKPPTGVNSRRTNGSGRFHWSTPIATRTHPPDFRSNPVPHPLRSFFDRTIGTAVEGPVYFYPMTNNAAATVMTGRSQGSNRTFKAVENMFLPGHHHLKGLIIVIATPFTLSHIYSSLYYRVLVTRYSICPDSLVVMG